MSAACRRPSNTKLERNGLGCGRVENVATSTTKYWFLASAFWSALTGFERYGACPDVYRTTFRVSFEAKTRQLK